MGDIIIKNRQKEWIVMPFDNRDDEMKLKDLDPEQPRMIVLEYTHFKEDKGRFYIKKPIDFPEPVAIIKSVQLKYPRFYAEVERFKELLCKIKENAKPLMEKSAEKINELKEQSQTGSLNGIISNFGNNIEILQGEKRILIEKIEEYKEKHRRLCIAPKGETKEEKKKREKNKKEITKCIKALELNIRKIKIENKNTKKLAEEKMGIHSLRTIDNCWSEITFSVYGIVGKINKLNKIYQNCVLGQKQAKLKNRSKLTRMSERRAALCVRKKTNKIEFLFGRAQTMAETTVSEDCFSGITIEDAKLLDIMIEFEKMVENHINAIINTSINLTLIGACLGVFKNELKGLDDGVEQIREKLRKALKGGPPENIKVVIYVIITTCYANCCKSGAIAKLYIAVMVSRMIKEKKAAPVFGVLLGLAYLSAAVGIISLVFVATPTIPLICLLLEGIFGILGDGVAGIALIARQRALGRNTGIIAGAT